MATAHVQPRNPMLAVLGIPNFRLIWIGQCTSLLGDYFNMIALPWLVLQVTGDAFALGTVLALEGVPRALFMLVGGAITDRFSPRTIMLLSDLGRLFLCMLLTAMVITGTVDVWLLYAIALGFGFVSGFFQPASGAILPRIVQVEDLQGANAVYQGSTQFLGFIGPMLAGAVIAAFGTAEIGAGGSSSLGVAVAFTLDAISFLVSVSTLWLMRVSTTNQAGAGAPMESVFASIRRGVQYLRHDDVMLMLFAVIAAANLFFVGPVDVGIPVLAKFRLPEGVAAFGIIVGGFAGGNLLGTILSGILAPKRGFRILMIALLFAFGLGLASFGWLPSTWAGFAVLFVLGIGNGYLGIILITLLQRRTPPEMMGRIMSLLILSNVGLLPISQAVSGWVVNYDLEALFVGAGALLVLVAVWSAFSPALARLASQVEQSAQAGGKT